MSSFFIFIFWIKKDQLFPLIINYIFFCLYLLIKCHQEVEDTVRNSNLRKNIRTLTADSKKKITADQKRASVRAGIIKNKINSTNQHDQHQQDKDQHQQDKDQHQQQDQPQVQQELQTAANIFSRGRTTDNNREPPAAPIRTTVSFGSQSSRSQTTRTSGSQTYTKRTPNRKAH